MRVGMARREIFRAALRMAVACGFASTFGAPAMAEVLPRPTQTEGTRVVFAVADQIGRRPVDELQAVLRDVERFADHCRESGERIYCSAMRVEDLGLLGWPGPIAPRGFEPEFFMTSREVRLCLAPERSTAIEFYYGKDPSLPRIFLEEHPEAFEFLRGNRHFQPSPEEPEMGPVYPLAGDVAEAAAAALGLLPYATVVASLSSVLVHGYPPQAASAAACLGAETSTS